MDASTGSASRGLGTLKPTPAQCAGHDRVLGRPLLGRRLPFHGHAVQTQAVCPNALCLGFPICGGGDNDHAPLRALTVLRTGPGTQYKLINNTKCSAEVREQQAEHHNSRQTVETSAHVL